jgi:hypothetical protein
VREQSNSPIIWNLLPGRFLEFEVSSKQGLVRSEIHFSGERVNQLLSGTWQKHFNCFLSSGGLVLARISAGNLVLYRI